MKLKLTGKRHETPDVESLIFQPDEPISWQAGQFLHYTLHHEPTDERGSDRWFTISSSPNEDFIMISTRFTTKNSSSFKSKLQRMRTGDEIEAEGPEGDFVVDNIEQPKVFIAGGIGITPYRSILLDLDHNSKPLNITLLYANRAKDNVPFKKELDSLSQKHPEFKIHYIYTPQRVDKETIKKYVPNLNKPLFYVSGPEPMVEAMGETLKKMDIPESHIKQDFFPGYPAD